MRGLAFLTVTLFINGGFASERVDFNRDVRPILAAKCFKCHGPDPKTREADLRLDTQAGLFEQHHGTTPFVPGQPERSEALRRVLSDDEFEKMPPPEAKKDLTAEEASTIRMWIEEGAQWEPHWAFLSPVRHKTPEVVDETWPFNPIDQFVLARMEREDFHPSPQADPSTLVRRVYLDLIGLPPTPAQADEYINDPSEEAYERLVDRLLSSPHYGERWARRWLDLARYADTNGYEKDRPRSIWPYRDWVIDAINSGMPFDEFTIKQLAGDMLPDATINDRIATGFHRNTMLNEEGGIDPLEFRYHAVVDRVATTGTTWLGLTTGCAQCHDHKYDPISHREYFGLLAFLNNADEPQIALPDPTVDAAYAVRLKTAEKLLAELPSKWPLDVATEWTPAKLIDATTERGEVPQRLEDESVFFPGTGFERDNYTLSIETDLPSIERIKIEALADSRLPSGGPGRTPHGNFVLSDVTIEAIDLSNEEVLASPKIVSASALQEQQGFPAAAAIDGDQATGWAVHVPGKPLNVNQTIDLTFAEPIRSSKGVRFAIKLSQQHGAHHTIGRLRVLVPKATRGPIQVQEEIVEQHFQDWLAKERARTVPWTTLRPSEVTSNLPLLTVEEDDSVFVTGDTTKQDTYRLTLPLPDRKVKALRLEALPDERLPDGGPGLTYYEGTLGDFFLTELSFTVDDESISVAESSHSYSKNRFGSNPATAAMAVDGDRQTGWSVDGRQGERHTAVFVLEEPVVGKELRIEMNFGRHFASSLGRFRWSFTEGDAATARDLPADVEALLGKSDAEWTEVERQKLKTEFLLSAEEVAEHAAKIKSLRKRPDFPSSLVFTERPSTNARPTFMHNRGEFLQPTVEVDPLTLETLHPFPESLPRTRLGFAKWLVAPENPLTARVIVNRHWGTLFGRGLVSTEQDFGFQGEPPSHPELLDWLAMEFIQASGPLASSSTPEAPAPVPWDLKRLHRLIVTSATYRQSSLATLDQRKRDPQNILLSRGPRQRLEAEMIRDSALVASNLLTPKLGGEPVRPPQPEGVTEAAYGSPKWTPDTGEDRYRRSLYTFIKRTAPFALYSVFDAPSGEACIAKRDVSNTALQSLTLLNDIVFMEAAQALGHEATTYDGDDDETIHLMYRKILTRNPTGSELDRLREFVKLQRGRFASDREQARTLAGEDDGDVTERAVWTALARALLSLDEATTRS